MEITEPGPVGRRNHASRPFPPWHRADRSFFLLFVALCWLGVVMGFLPAVTKRLAGEADYAAPLILHIHIVAFTAWLLLLTAQIVLIRARRTPVHKKLGLAGVVLIPVMAVTALLAEVYSQRFYFDHPPNSQAFFIVPITYALAFAGLAGAALLLRRNSSAHKRLIVLATIVIVGAAYARWWGEALAQSYGDGFWGMIVNTYTGTNLLLAGAVGYDLLTRRRIHPVYAVGVPALLLGELAVSSIYHAPGWLPIARVLIGR
jgi:uncharacterized membrane protein